MKPRTDIDDRMGRLWRRADELAPTYAEVAAGHADDIRAVDQALCRAFAPRPAPIVTLLSRAVGCRAILTVNLSDAGDGIRLKCELRDLEAAFVGISPFYVTVTTPAGTPVLDTAGGALTRVCVPGVEWVSPPLTPTDYIIVLTDAADAATAARRVEISLERCAS